jgi:hypothetical protein
MKSIKNEKEPVTHPERETREREKKVYKSSKSFARMSILKSDIQVV